MNESNRQPAGTQFLRKVITFIAILSLVYYAWMMFDLVTHPFDTGTNAVILPYLFRWLSAFSGTFTVVVAVFILRRMPGNFVALLLLIFGVGVTIWSQRLDLGSMLANNVNLVFSNTYFFFLAFPTLSALLFHFPSGQVYPARFTGWAWGLVLFQAFAGMLAIAGTPSFQNDKIHNIMHVPALLPVAGMMNTLMVLIAPPAAIFTLILRYRASNERERLKIKWLAWLSAMAILVSVLNSLIFPDIKIENTTRLVSQLVKFFDFLYWQIFPALAIGIALLRYRLWDIDVIIRRTLLYSTLTALIGLLYFTSVVLLQQIFSSLTGRSTMAIVLSTLLIAALFEPIRRRLQTFIDQRFYRQKYNAELALEEFSSAARREVDMDHLTAQVVGVVEKTVQPEAVSMWLRKERR
jgi:hypothetical protein